MKLWLMVSALLGIKSLIIYLSRMYRLVLISLFLIPSLSFSQARRALSLVDKDKYDEAYELLSKATSKDSLASAEQYAFSTLLFNQNFQKYDLDSSYHYILLAIETYDILEEKEQIKLSKNGFDLALFSLLKNDIETAGFIRAKENGKEQDFIEFLTDFPSSTHIDSAIVLRNSQAFITARNGNTVSSYKHFFETYPDAKEVQEARKRYEKLLYDNKTANGKLISFQQFLKDYPNTWHRNEAEQHIYDIITGRNSEESYNEFINQYPESYLREQAGLMQYSLLTNDEIESFLNGGLFSSSAKDSIRLLETIKKQLLIPVFSTGFYQIINSRGDIILDSIGSISQNNKCLNKITGPLLVSINDEASLLSLDGSIIDSGQIISAEDIGLGTYRIATTKSQYFMNQSGVRTSSNEFTHVRRVGPFIAYSVKSKWGLESITGISMVNAQYDSLTSFFDFVILRKDKKWGLFKNEVFYPLLDSEEVSFNLIYDDILLLEDDHLLVTIGKKASLFNKEGEEVVPFEKQFIEIVSEGYFIDREDSVFDSRVSTSWYKSISSNDFLVIGEKESKSEIFYKNALLVEADKARLIGNSIALLSIGDSTFAYFTDTTKVMISKDELILPASLMGQNSSLRHYTVSKKNKNTIVYTNKGEVIEIDNFEKIIDVGYHYMLVKYKKSYSLLDDLGNLVLDDIDAATSLGNDYISYLDDGKFGLINSLDTTYIEAKYKKPLQAFSDTLFVFSEDGKQGIIDRNDSVRVNPIYSEIGYLNDTIAILNNNFRWTFWDITNSRALLDNVSDFWIEKEAISKVYKVLKGIGYGIWSPESGAILNPTYSEISIESKGEEVIFVGEKWVEEADIVIMLYYDVTGKLFRKDVLSTAEYEDLTCKQDQE